MIDFLWNPILKKTKLQRTVIDKLKENILFQDLNPAELTWLEKIVHLRTYQPGEVVFKQGDLGVGMYIIAKGTVNIYVEELNPQSGEVKSQLVTQLKENDFLGDLALVEVNSRRSATALCQDECSLIGFFKPDLIEVTERNARSGVKILFRLSEVLGQRLKETTSKITVMRKKLQEKELKA